MVPELLFEIVHISKVEKKMMKNKKIKSKAKCKNLSIDILKINNFIKYVY